MHDVIIVGGSYAGLAAALQLARARRSVLVLDAGERRNRFAAHSHGFLGQDGQPPAAIAAKGRSEVLAYPTVTWQDARVAEARATTRGFAVRAGGQEHEGKRLILATGVIDELPAIPGLAERWGQTAFLCPYCDGYELGRGRLGALATGPSSLHHAIIASEWAAKGQMTFFLNDVGEPDREVLADLAARGIAVERAPVAAVSGQAPAVVLHHPDGRTSALDGLFLLPRTRLASPFAEPLGCRIQEGRLGPFYWTEETKETSVPGVFACGDNARDMPGVAFAVADGVRAGAAAHQSLVFRADRPPALPAR
jgi:thioredoxin reductase